MHYYGLSSNLRTKDDIHLMNSNIQLSDDLFKFSEYVEAETTAEYVETHFIEQHNNVKRFVPIPESVPIPERKYATITLRADHVSRLYYREVETILDFFGDIGGFIELVSLIGFSCTAAFVTRSMNSEMIKEVYQVQRYT